MASTVYHHSAAQSSRETPTYADEGKVKDDNSLMQSLQYCTGVHFPSGES